MVQLASPVGGVTLAHATNKYGAFQRGGRIRAHKQSVKLSPCFEYPNKMLKASNSKDSGFSLGFEICNPLRAERTPER